MSVESGSDRDLDDFDESMLQVEECQKTRLTAGSPELQRKDRNRETSIVSEEFSRPSGEDMGTPLRHTKALRMRQQHDSTTRLQTSASTFYLDNNKIELDHTVIPSKLPLQNTAQQLIDSYLATVQTTFPMLAEPPFRHQFEQLYAPSPHPHSATNAWLGLLNLVFAIGRRQLDLAEEARPPDEQDHSVYWSRAHVLGLEAVHDIGCADITQVQSTGLLALYLLSVGHVNR